MISKAKVSNDEELIVNKKSASFIEKLLNRFGCDVEHIIYKDIVYSNKYPKTKRHEFIKNLYDSYKYLLMNKESLFSQRVLKRFYYILTEKCLDDEVIRMLVNKYYLPHNMDVLEHTIEMYFSIDEAFKEDEYKDYILYLYLNSMLVSNGLLQIRFIYSQFIEFENAVQEYKNNNKSKMYETLLKLVINEKHQSKSHYENLKVLTFKEIYSGIKEDKELLNKVYEVKSVSLYGSFLHDDERLDSDIDLLVEFNEDISYKTKLRKKQELEDYLYHKFKRYVDVLELRNDISDRLIEVIKNAKLIIN